MFPSQIRTKYLLMKPGEFGWPQHANLVSLIWDPVTPFVLVAEKIYMVYRLLGCFNVIFLPQCGIKVILGKFIM